MAKKLLPYLNAKGNLVIPHEDGKLETCLAGTDVSHFRATRRKSKLDKTWTETEYKTNHILYRTYKNIRDETAKSAKEVKGPYMCQKWRDNFWLFVEDLAPLYPGEKKDGVTLEYVLSRKRIHLGYTPTNTVWVLRDKHVTASNSLLGRSKKMRSDVILRKNGAYKKHYNLSYSSEVRINKNLSRTDLFNEQVEKYGPIVAQRPGNFGSIIVEFYKHKRTLSSWSRVTGISYHTLKSRLLEMGWSVQDSLTKPPKIKAGKNKNTESEQYTKWVKEFNNFRANYPDMDKLSSRMRYFISEVEQSGFRASHSEKNTAYLKYIRDGVIYVIPEVIEYEEKRTGKKFKPSKFKYKVVRIPRGEKFKAKRDKREIKKARRRYKKVNRELNRKLKRVQ